LRSTTIYESMADVEAIHGHDGRTRIVWIDLDGDYTWSCVMCGGGLTREWCSDCGAHGATALVPLWWADDAEQHRHLRWESGVRAAEAAVSQCHTVAQAIEALRDMRERHERDEARRRQEREARRSRVSPGDARIVVWRSAALAPSKEQP
jgi:hypothetical protein